MLLCPMHTLATRMHSWSLLASQPPAAERWQFELVYTYVGDIVVSVNPFKNTGCYGKAIRSKFKGGVRRTLPPHIYALVEQAYGEMNRNQISQSILISGESGAGKIGDLTLPDPEPDK